MRSPWCASACAPRTIRASATPCGSSMPSSRSICPPGPAGAATTATATASTRTAGRSTGPGSAGPGRSSPESARITRRPYRIEGVPSRHGVWRFNNKCRSLAAGTLLRVELLAAAAIHWTSDAWRTIRDTPTQDSGFGIHFADLDTAGLAAGGGIVFTIHWTAEDRWEGVDYGLAIT